MAKFIVDENFQFGGSLRRAQASLEVDDFATLAEQAKGENDETGKPISGLLNHCTPADEHTEGLLAGTIKPKRDAAAAQKENLANAKEKEIERLRGEFDKLGKAYNPRWAIDKLGKELKAAKKEAGVAKKDAPKKTEVVKTAKVTDDLAEIEKVRAEITALGGTFHPRAGLEKLKVALEDAKKGVEK